MPRLRANWAQRVPALALGAAVLPHRSSGPTRLASMRPVERVPELQSTTILLKGLAGLPAALEDGAEERVDDGRAGHAPLDLLQLVRGLVEHLQLEEDPAERHGEGEIVGRPLARRSVERDHAARPALLPICPLEPGEEGERGETLGGRLPSAPWFGGASRQLG